MPQTVLITGTSSGFGELAAKLFAEKGWNVVATMRNPAAGEQLAKLGDNVFVTALDVQKQDTIDAAVAAAVAKFGKIDVLVNNAGYGSLGFFEGISEEEIKRQYDVNNFGVMRVTKAVLPHMREQRSGNIVIVSSVLGEISGFAFSLYGSTKYGVEGWAECMAYEVAPFGIQVKIVQPGAFKTKFIGGNQSVAEPPKGVPEYKAQFEALQGMLAQLEPNLAEASPVAEAILKASTDRDNANFRFPVFDEKDGYGQLFNLRRAQGPEAQVTAMRSMFNEGKAPETEPELTGPQTVLITGASTGFGRQTAQDMAAKGWNVVATMRNTEAGAELAKLGDHVQVLELDVTKQDTIDAAVAAAIAKFGKIDILVNNAGFANFGFVEGTTMQELENQYDVNVYGPMRVTKAVLPHMREARFGQIVNVSSVMGYESTMLSSTYSSSKWILDGWSESLQYELAPFGIQVKMVQPGAFKTAISSKLVMSAPPAGVPEYTAMFEAMQAALGPAIAAAKTPEAVSEVIYKASIERNPVKNRYPVWSEGDFYGALYELRKTQGPDAQRAAVFASMNPDSKSE